MKRDTERAGWDSHPARLVFGYGLCYDGFRIRKKGNGEMSEWMEMEQAPVRYCGETPEWMEAFCCLPELQRLRDVGMNCGCEYTAFARFRGLPRYSRFRHSLGVCRIVWHFTDDRTQALAGLFHDIATPCFAHTVDFLHGDHLRQEYTEGRTESIIRGSAELCSLLKAYGIDVDAVTDYHRYPVADNDSPRLSADRLEYTLGNLACYGLRDVQTLQAYYDAICVENGADGVPELAFASEETAYRFALDALKMSRIYVAEEARYAMQRLSELLRRAMERGVLSAEALYGTEPEVIAALTGDADTRTKWESFRALHEMLRDRKDAPDGAWRVIPSKKRCIDPLVCGRGRLSEISTAFAGELAVFLQEPQDAPLCAR